MLSDFNLEGKVAIVTGAAGGLGSAMAVGLAESGADLILIDKVSSKKTASAITKTGRNFFSIELDLLALKPDDAMALVDYATKHFGRIDILVNNAGIIHRRPSVELNVIEWEETLSLNLNTVFYLSQAFAKHLLNNKKGGKIINIASMLSFQGGLMVASYTAAKSAIVGLTKALANEWAPNGINVNAIAPGYFKTKVTEGIYLDPHRHKKIIDRIPAGRWGTPADLKGTVVFLASNAASYLHGITIPVDGGWLAR